MPAPSAAILKSQIEAQLAHRIPAALSPLARQEAERQPLHDPHLTELLGGGVPVGAITEMHGDACSGRTSIALSVAAAVTAAARVVAWVDVSDELDPETAALCGVDLERLLWVRCGRPAVQGDDASDSRGPGCSGQSQRHVHCCNTGRPRQLSSSGAGAQPGRRKPCAPSGWEWWLRKSASAGRGARHGGGD